MISPICGLTAALAIAVCSTQAVLARPILHVLRPIHGSLYSSPIDISADGSVIVGQSVMPDPELEFRSFRQVWPQRAKEIVMDLPQESSAVAVSADGSVVLGFTYDESAIPRSYRWTKETGPVDLTPDTNLVVAAVGLSGNGEVAVGEFETLDRFNSRRLPLFWSAAGGVERLSTPEDGSSIAANYDGSVIVGAITWRTNGLNNYACRWINKGEPELLLPLETNTIAVSVTPDGTAILGFAFDAGWNPSTFRWTASAGVEWITPLSGYPHLQLFDQSEDGSIAVGSAANADNRFVGVLWTAEDGVRDLNELYQSALPCGWRIVYAAGISGDGRWIIGTLESSSGDWQAFLLDTEQTCKKKFDSRSSWFRWRR